MFSINVVTILGLGLAIDYGLFMVGRFREEIAARLGVEDAVARTMATAGRTVAVSGVTVAVSAGRAADLPAGRSCARWAAAGWPPCWSRCSPR